MSKPSIAALILAGGQSSRMGQDKALIKLQGVPLLRRVYDIAQACVDQVSVITPRWQTYRAILPPTCQFLEEQVIPGVPFPHGPLVGFYQGLTQIQTEWILLLACDLPCLNRFQFQEWIECLSEDLEGIAALLPRNPKGWEPLCGFYHRRCLTSLENFVNQGGRSFQQWLSTCSVQELAVENSQMLFNCNTPEQLSRAANYLF